jgi:hypothetical protein
LEIRGKLMTSSETRTRVLTPLGQVKDPWRVTRKILVADDDGIVE